MNDDAFSKLEQKLSNLQSPEAPTELREAVLGCVRRQLFVNRWERRLTRATVGLILIGVAMNVVNWQPHRNGETRFVSKPTPESLVQAGVALAEVTDVETGNLFAEHLAALSGTPLTSQQKNVIHQEIQKHISSDPVVRKAG